MQARGNQKFYGRHSLLLPWSVLSPGSSHVERRPLSLASGIQSRPIKRLPLFFISIERGREGGKEGRRRNPELTLGNFVPTHLPCLHGARGGSVARTDMYRFDICGSVVLYADLAAAPSPAWCSRGDAGIRIRRLWGGNANMPDQTHSCGSLHAAPTHGG